MLSQKDLIGAWGLVAHYYLDDDGTRSEGPLGDDAAGLLLYQDDGYMAASMMRTTTPSATPAAYLGSADDYLGYSGRWQVRDDLVIHQVSIGSHARVVGTEQIREARWGDDGCLSLRRRLDGPHDYIVMDWRRI